MHAHTHHNDINKEDITLSCCAECRILFITKREAFHHPRECMPLQIRLCQTTYPSCPSIRAMCTTSEAKKNNTDIIMRDLHSRSTSIKLRVQNKEHIGLSNIAAACHRLPRNEQDNSFPSYYSNFFKDDFLDTKFRFLGDYTVSLREAEQYAIIYELSELAGVLHDIAEGEDYTIMKHANCAMCGRLVARDCTIWNHHGEDGECRSLASRIKELDVEKHQFYDQFVQNA